MISISSMPRNFVFSLPYIRTASFQILLQYAYFGNNQYNLCLGDDCPPCFVAHCKDIRQIKRGTSCSVSYNEGPIRDIWSSSVPVVSLLIWTFRKTVYLHFYFQYISFKPTIIWITSLVLVSWIHRIMIAANLCFPKKIRHITRMSPHFYQM